MRGLGYRPSMTPRPGFAEAHAHLMGGALPEEDLHLVDHVQGILDQGMAEQCVGAALAQAAQVQLSAEGLPAVLPSGSFIWYNARASLGDRDFNVGTYIYSGVEAVSSFGLPPDSDWPLARAEWDFAERPSHAAYQHGYDARFDARMYGVGQSVDEVKSAVRLGPVVFGTMVSRAFVEAGPHTDPIQPPDGADVVGGHAMTIVGYDRGGVRVPQTWGTGAGNNGWYYLSWEYLMSDLTSEIVVVKYVPRLEAA